MPNTLSILPVNVSRDNWQSTSFAPFPSTTVHFSILPINFVYCVWWLVYTWDVLNPKTVRFHPFRPREISFRLQNSGAEINVLFGVFHRLDVIYRVYGRKHKTPASEPSVPQFSFLSLLSGKRIKNIITPPEKKELAERIRNPDITTSFPIAESFSSFGKKKCKWNSLPCRCRAHFEIGLSLFFHPINPWTTRLPMGGSAEEKRKIITHKSLMEKKFPDFLPGAFHFSPIFLVHLLLFHPQAIF